MMSGFSRRDALKLFGGATAMLMPGVSHALPQAPGVAADRARRMQWWHDARFGMFIHWGSYSVLGRHEWSMENEAIPVAEYEGSAGDAPRPPDGTAPSADRFTDDDHRP